MKNLIVIILALSVTTFANAQAEILLAATNPALIEDLAAEGMAGAFGETLLEGNEEKAINGTNTGFVREAKEMTANFTGYSVQITTSNRKLENTNKLFQEFGGIMFQENLNPKYAYYVGQFKTKEGAEKYINTVIGQRYPTAKVITFKNGKAK